MSNKMANPEAGEVDLVLGDETGIICARMAALAQLSHQIGSKSLAEIYQRISGAEPMAMYSAIDCLLIEGKPAKLKANINSPDDLYIVSAAVLKSLEALMGDSQGK